MIRASYGWRGVSSYNVGVMLQMPKSLSRQEKEESPTAQLAIADADPVRMYLKEIGQVKLLSVNEEFWLSTCVTAANWLLALQTVGIDGLSPAPSGRELLLEIWEEIATTWRQVHLSLKHI